MSLKRLILPKNARSVIILKSILRFGARTTESPGPNRNHLNWWKRSERGLPGFWSPGVAVELPNVGSAVRSPGGWIPEVLIFYLQNLTIYQSVNELLLKVQIIAPAGLFLWQVFQSNNYGVQL